MQVAPMHVSARDIESEDDENEAKADAEGSIVNMYCVRTRSKKIRICSRPPYYLGDLGAPG